MNVIARRKMEDGQKLYNSESNGSDNIGDITTDVDYFIPPSWMIHIELSYLGIVSVFGVPVNILIILVQAKIVDKSSTDYFVLAMGILEAICTGINVPIRMMMSSDTVWRNIASPTLCGIRAFVLYIVTMSSAFLLAAIAMDRYIKTCHPFNRGYNPNSAKKINIIIGTVSVMCGIPNLPIYTLNEKNQCSFMQYAVRFKEIWDYAMACLTVVIFIVIALAYLSISLHIHKRHKRRVNKTAQSVTSEADRPAGCCCRFRRGKVFPTIGRTEKTHNSQVATVFSRRRGTNGNQPSIETDEGRSGISLQRTSFTENMTNLETTSKQRRSLLATRINRTTKTMFLITLVYLLLWMTTWIRVFSFQSAIGSAVFVFSRSFYMIGCFSNPLIYICMSSRFREKAKQVFFNR